MILMMDIFLTHWVLLTDMYIFYGNNFPITWSNTHILSTSLPKQVNDLQNVSFQTMANVICLMSAI